MPGVLTNKQCWRRQAINYRHFDDNDKVNTVLRSFSESSLPHSGSSLLSCRKQWSTMNDLQTTSRHDVFGNRRKSVMFSARVHVVLIPCITEYETAGLANLMWWTDEDYKLFKQYALEEVKEFMLRFKIMDSKEAIRRLYQHQDDPISLSFHGVETLPGTSNTTTRTINQVKMLPSNKSEPKYHAGEDDQLPSFEHKDSQISIVPDVCSPQNNITPDLNPMSANIQEVPPLQLYIKSPAMLTKYSLQDGLKSVDDKVLSPAILEEPIHPLALMCL